MRTWDDYKNHVTAVDSEIAKEKENMGNLKCTSTTSKSY